MIKTTISAKILCDKSVLNKKKYKAVHKHTIDSKRVQSFLYVHIKYEIFLLRDFYNCIFECSKFRNNICSNNEAIFKIWHFVL